jgi:predicted flavoprotein YhiN
MRLQYNKDLSGLPKRLQRILKDRARGESGDVRTKKLASLLDHDDFTVASVDERGMVTAGGVALSEIDLNTMQIKSFANENAHAHGTGALYVIGEAIDADGITGGYNLQLCWSTALTAADSIASDLHP